MHHFQDRKLNVNEPSKTILVELKNRIKLKIKGDNIDANSLLIRFKTDEKNK